ncbi:RRP15-like protein [Armadillidium vulgare]|nr:RRP15-like protein [Armadillidium vulgare]
MMKVILMMKELRKRIWRIGKEKKRLMEMGRVIPKQSTNREKERNLRIMATQGVVQLFSAINKHKVELRNELKEAKSHNQRDKVLANKGLDNFMNLLEKEGKKLKKNKKKDYELSPVKKEENLDSIKLEESESKSSWNALAQEFYQEPVLKEWDKCDSDEG